MSQDVRALVRATRALLAHLLATENSDIKRAAEADRACCENGPNCPTCTRVSALVTALAPFRRAEDLSPEEIATIEREAHCKVCGARVSWEPFGGAFLHVGEDWADLGEHNVEIEGLDLEEEDA